MKRKTAIIITVLIFGGWTVWSVISGIVGLSKSEFVSASLYSESGKLCEVNIDFAMEVYEVRHSLNVIIPTGKEHFYFAASEDSEIPLLIKERPSWYTENFDEDGLAVRTVTVVGEVRKFDSEIKYELRNVETMLAAAGAAISTDVYLSGSYKTLYILRLVSGLSMITAGALFVFVVMRLGSTSKAAATAAVIFGIIALLFSLFVLICGNTV